MLAWLTVGPQLTALDSFKLELEMNCEMGNSWKMNIG